MTNMFSRCSGFGQLNLKSFNTSNTFSMAYMFDECKGLKSLDLSKFDTSNVEDMTGMFEKCSSLESLDLENFNTLNVSNYTSIFLDCQKLSYINLLNYAGVDIFMDLDDTEKLEICINNYDQIIDENGNSLKEKKVPIKCKAEINLVKVLFMVLILTSIFTGLLTHYCK